MTRRGSGSSKSLGFSSFGLASTSVNAVHGTYLIPGTSTTTSISYVIPAGVKYINVEAIGAGKAAYSGYYNGGGGGAYAASYNLKVSPGQTVYIGVTSSDYNSPNAHIPVWLNTQSNTPPTDVKFGVKADSANPTIDNVSGGLVANCIGQISYAGGTGGQGNAAGYGGGGGGAAGPDGPGRNGGQGNSVAGGGGGGCDGLSSTAGASNPASTAAAVGGAGPGGSGGGAYNSAAVANSGGGGGGGYFILAAGNGAGYPIARWNSPLFWKGPGGGGGGMTSGSNAAGFTSGFGGGAGGGCNYSSQGGPSVIVITY